eukprot:Skav216114  [mRNA]  locus=scaffold1946:131761:137288:+ [translate_table: standard]
MPSEGSMEAPPPPSGLGNFKGVMLCNRPSDGTKLASDGKEPFRSAVAQTSELGLRPVRNFKPTIKKRGPSAALRRHVRWLRELQEQMREDRQQVEQEEQDAEEKRQKLKITFDKHRAAVRDMVKAKARLSETSAMEKERPAPAKASKPLWAMTEQEKDHFEEEEADDLINFVENLDFDEFVGDLEFRQALGALKDRAGKLQKQQDAFKDELFANFNAYDDEEASTAAGSAKLEDGVDGQGIVGDLKSEYSVASSRRCRKEGRENVQKDWDNSTNADDRPEVDQEAKDMAEAVLEQNPKFRAIHSGASVQKIIEKVKGDQAAEAG